MREVTGKGVESPHHPVSAEVAQLAISADGRELDEFAASICAMGGILKEQTLT